MDESTMKRHLRPFAALCASLCTVALGSGCNLFDDLDAYSEMVIDGGDDPGDSGSRLPDDNGDRIPGCESSRTLCVRLASFGPHVEQKVGLDLVSADNILRARAILDPMSRGGAQSADIVLPLAIDETEVPASGEKSSLELQIFGDADEDGEYTEDGGDHSWKVPLPASATLVYQHNTLFVPLTPRPKTVGGDFRLKFTGMSVHKGALLEVMVIEAATGRPVGLYRLQSIPGDAFEIAIPGIIDGPGVTYNVEFYADANNSGEYEDPNDNATGDHAWFRQVESNDDKDATLEFKHGTDFRPLKYQRKFKN
jgi:hypothetical protein